MRNYCINKYLSGAASCRLLTVRLLLTLGEKRLLKKKISAEFWGRNGFLLNSVCLLWDFIRFPLLFSGTVAPQNGIYTSQPFSQQVLTYECKQRQCDSPARHPLHWGKAGAHPNCST